MANINILKELGTELLQINKPACYTGGELGSIIHSSPQALKMAISFPDKYEIGMSNQAIRILYNRYNRIPGIQCERVFAPAQDFEALLRKKNLPLCTLETGIPLHELNILALSIGYELTLTNLLTILELGNIPLKRWDRSASDPIIAAGGPAATNPQAFSDFVDYVYIGEGEVFINNHARELARAAAAGAGKEALEEIFRKDPAYWWPGKKKQAKRAVFAGFGETAEPASNMPIASLTTVQDHGVIEIMRGCPNGCRFCHAGYYYRPFRQKDRLCILQEADHLVKNCGYRNITLSSLSSGDYQDLLPLVRYLNSLYKKRHISFQLPSLRVNSLNLGLMSEISTVRKSGLTFAVENPFPKGQNALNKDVSTEHILSLLQEARSLGWKQAKFYFMVGLPVEHGEGRESEGIINFLQETQKKSGMKFNVNVGIFIPKAHTPYERAPQLNDSQAMEEIRILKEGLRGRNFKFGFHSPYSSFIEGIISRGDERVGALIEKAYRKGARFDAWEEHHDRRIWQEVVAEADWDVERESCRSRDEKEALPWDSISLRVSSAFLKNEARRSAISRRTAPCQENCILPCGVCTKEKKVRLPQDELPPIPIGKNPAEEKPDDESRFKVILAFEKKNEALYLGHLDTLHVFERAIQCSGLDIAFTKGFNPKPKMEFAHPLSLGIEGRQEIMGLEMSREVEEEEIPSILKRLNRFFPAGFKGTAIMTYPLQREKQKKKKTLMGLYAGSLYTLIPIIPGKYPLTSQWIAFLYEKARELDVANDYAFEAGKEQKSLKIKALFKNKKMNNVLKFMGEATGIPALEEWKVIREKLFAFNDQGKVADYFSLDSSQN